MCSTLKPIRLKGRGYVAAIFIKKMQVAYFNLYSKTLILQLIGKFLKQRPQHNACAYRDIK